MVGRPARVARFRGQASAPIRCPLRIQRVSSGIRQKSQISHIRGCFYHKNIIRRSYKRGPCARSTTTPARDPPNRGRLHPVSRLSLRASSRRCCCSALRRTATPFVEAAGRGDGGDGLTGAGIELAGGVRYRAPGLEVEARGRWLAAHVETGARERGVSVAARVGPGAPRARPVAPAGAALGRRDGQGRCTVERGAAATRRRHGQ